MGNWAQRESADQSGGCGGLPVCFESGGAAAHHHLADGQADQDSGVCLGPLGEFILEVGDVPVNRANEVGVFLGHPRVSVRDVLYDDRFRELRYSIAQGDATGKVHIVQFGVPNVEAPDFAGDIGANHDCLSGGWAFEGEAARGHVRFGKEPLAAVNGGRESVGVVEYANRAIAHTDFGR